MKPTPTLLEAAKALISVYDEQSNVAQRIICGGRSDRQLREDGLAALKDLRDAVAALSVPAAAVVGEPEPLVKFAKDMLACAWEGGDADGGYIQDQAEKYGLIRAVKFDSKIHRDRNGYAQDGEDWFEYSGPLSAAPSAPDGWQPIDSAPKDGTKILAWSGFWDKHHLIRWNQGENAWCEGSWCFGSVPDMVWMPLPAPPALGGASHD